MPFLTVDALAVNTIQNVLAPRRPVRQLQYLFYPPNIMIYSLNPIECKL